MERTTIFLSHSSKDIDKVRKIRDILETIGYEPLIFYLKCLDDKNKQLEEFIKDEIEARNVFIYCKSKNAEASEWVQKELEYIKSFSTKRLYEIDIERPLRDTLIGLLQSIATILKSNRVFISCSHKPVDMEFGNRLRALLTEKGYEVIRYDTFDPTRIDEHKDMLFDITETGIFIPVISYNSLASFYCMSELEIALDRHRQEQSFVLLPLFFNISRSVAYAKSPRDLAMYNGVDVTEDNLAEQIDGILNRLK